MKFTLGVSPIGSIVFAPQRPAVSIISILNEYRNLVSFETYLLRGFNFRLKIIGCVDLSFEDSQHLNRVTLRV